jgi:hypothetical protein
MRTQVGRNCRGRVMLEALEPRQLLSAAVTTVFKDSFSGRGPLTAWTKDVSYLGRTQLADLLPVKVGGAVKLTIDSYNPTGYSFYGTGIVSDKVITPEAGKTVVVTVRAKLDVPITGGYVGGLFLYPLNAVAGQNSELDFELSSAHLTQAETNVYANEPLGEGHPEAVDMPASGAITGWHVYQLSINPGVAVTWSIDGAVVRTESTYFPSGPMQLRINLWAPAAEWQWAYSAEIGPVSDAAQNTRASMSVDYAVIQEVKNPAAVSGVSVNLSGDTVYQRGAITGGGTMEAAGYGTVKYAWMVTGPNGKTVRVGGIYTAKINNGKWVIASSKKLPTSALGTYRAWVHIYGVGNGQDSNVVSYTVTEAPPTIAITNVPPAGAWGVSLGGRVKASNLGAYKVAVYINVNGGWWTKPSWTWPDTTINVKTGGWSCVVTTGGNDDEAGEYRAYLLPKDLVTPLAYGETVLPSELEPYIYADVTR